MKYELGDHSIVRCPEMGLCADIDFKTKGWVSGTYNAIGGTIRNEITGEVLYEISGLWSEEMFIKDLKASFLCQRGWHSSADMGFRLDTKRCSSTL
jgi:oxysterol-binding protein-related protein 8